MLLKLSKQDIHQEQLLYFYNQAKLNALTSTNYNFYFAKNAISNIYTDNGFALPNEFIEYKSIVAAIKDYASWKDKIVTLPTNWNYKTPFTWPWGIWHRIFSEAKNFHLGYRRQYAYLKRTEIVDGGENSVTRDFITEIYRFMLEVIPLEEREQLNAEVDNVLELDGVIEDLEFKLLEQDEIGMVSGDELFFLGNTCLMIFEAAVCNYLISEHNVKYYKPYIDNINDMIKYSGLSLAFGECCIICKKQ